MSTTWTSTVPPRGDQRVTYGDVFLRAEREYSAYNFEHADTAMLTYAISPTPRPNALHCC